MIEFTVVKVMITSMVEKAMTECMVVPVQIHIILILHQEMI